MSIINVATKGKVHIGSGIVLAVFVVSHFANHALGLFSIDTMEAMRKAFNVIWRSWPGTILLYGALSLHFVVALDALYRRRSLRMPASEAVKVFFGLCLPFLLIGHVVGTRVDFALYGHDKDYRQVLRILWSSTPGTIAQSIALIVAWTHACLGLWFWLRGRSWFERRAPLFHMAAIAFPILALLGFYSAARVVTAMPMRPGQYASDPEYLATIRLVVFCILATLIFGTLLIKILPHKGRIRVRYPGGKTATVSPGFSVLEASRSAGFPHVSICGGRGRCSTCRVQILQGMENQPPPVDREKATLESIGAPRDVRLACQLRPRHDLTVLPLVEADSLGQISRLTVEDVGGRERQVAALFCDLRGFTQLSEQKLPYDVVFLLNRYFAMVGEAVESSGGMVDKFIGDGAIALFGLEAPFKDACQQALTASVRLATGMEALNESFKTELDAPLRLAMGLHAGAAIVGRVGYGKATSLTAIGDTINTASRLEGLAKERNVELAVSADVVEQAGFSLLGHDRQVVSIRGRAAPVEIWIIPKAIEIERSLAEPTE